jgi:hypothetical protein
MPAPVRSTGIVIQRAQQGGLCRRIRIVRSSGDFFANPETNRQRPDRR